LSRSRSVIVALLVTAVAVPVATADAATKVFGSRALAKGAHGRDVRVLQGYLTTWGLRTAVDGQYGSTTARRVKSWERRASRKVDGKMSIADAKVLRSQVESGQHRADAPAQTPDTAPTTSVTPGTTGGAAALSPDAAGATSTAAAAAPVEKATLAPDGTAIAPASAPDAVKAIIAAGNEIAFKPYKYGGGHGRWIDSGYDCSGSMSYAFHGAGMLDTALDSTGFARWGAAGPGTWVTTYGNAGHSFMVVAGLRFDTSGATADGSRWHDTMRSASGYTVRHPQGL
jgi:cell wall-associated NlpC family hydrolase